MLFALEFYEFEPRQVASLHSFTFVCFGGDLSVLPEIPIFLGQDL
jgi:hypothetical protein